MFCNQPCYGEVSGRTALSLLQDLESSYIKDECDSFLWQVLSGIFQIAISITQSERISENDMIAKCHLTGHDLTVFSPSSL